jgi:HSP20 family protein
MSQLFTERRPQGAGRWEPIRDMEQVTDRMRRMLEQSLGAAPWAAPIAEGGPWLPLVDIEEEDDAYVIEAELPGVKREDVNIDLVGNELTISGEIKERERKGILRRRTRRVGEFEFRVALPEHVDPDKVDAKLSDGVLRVRVPKAERAERRRVEVAAG